MEKILLALLGVIGALFLGQKFKSARLEKKLSEALSEEKKEEVEKQSSQVALDNFTSLIAELSEIKKVKVSKPEAGGEQSSPTSFSLDSDIKSVAHADEAVNKTATTEEPSVSPLPEQTIRIARNQASRTKSLRGI